MFRRSLLILLGLVCIMPASEVPANLARGATVTVSSTMPGSAAAAVVDGSATAASSWISLAEQDPGPWLELVLPREAVLGGVHLYSGDGKAAPVSEINVQFRRGNQWIEIPSATVKGNLRPALALQFDATVAVKTKALRFTFTPGQVARIREIAVWAEQPDGIPKLGTGVTGDPMTTELAAESKDIPKLYLNQSGFNLGKPKAFTAPTLADGTPFTVTSKDGEVALFKGTISGNKGVFTAFDPQGPGEFVVRAGGLSSVPFGVGRWWLERVTYQHAVDFMIDSRHRVGNVRSPCKGSFGWRDDHAFAWELNTLVPQYLANPSAYDHMPRQIVYEKVAGMNGALEPYRADAPDIVKLIHWGADVIVTQHLDHEFFKEQAAFFVYAWPWLRAWLPAQNYAEVRAFLKTNWRTSTTHGTYPYDRSSDHNLLALHPEIGDAKGSLPPGHTVLPNLLMHAVALREHDTDAQEYLTAACAQAGWIVDHLDWHDPNTTKGQRMSEHVTMTGLAYLWRFHREQAPKGLGAKIREWAQVMIERSDNLWDFRRLSATAWTPKGDKPQQWNEPGNVVGFPACALAAIQVIDDPGIDRRLEELAYAHFDNMFGRNPCGRHFDFKAAQEIEGVEFGWYSRLQGGIGQLKDVRFVLDGSPKNDHYPYAPEKGNIGWTEGWVNFNTAFNLSLAYLAQHETEIKLVREGGDLRIHLRAPVNFKPAEVEHATVVVAESGKPERSLELTENAPDGDGFIGQIPVMGPVTVRYGYGYCAVSATAQ
jgi:F5/8 type C domain